jgi:AcrR family transcriptional regulator
VRTGHARRARTEARREAIVDAAVRLFATKGYRATSVAEVADAVGITDAGLLYHFPSKSDLLLEVLRHYDKIQRQRFDALVTGHGLDALRRVGDWGYVMEQHPEIASLHVVLSAEHLLEESPTNQFFRDRYERVLTRLRLLFERAIANGEIRPDISPALEAATLLAVMDGLRLQHFFSPRFSPLGDLLRGHVDQLIARIQIDTPDGTPI